MPHIICAKSAMLLQEPSPHPALSYLSLCVEVQSRTVLMNQNQIMASELEESQLHEVLISQNISVKIIAMKVCELDICDVMKCPY